MAASKPRLEYLIDTSALANIRDVHGDSNEIWLRVTNSIIAGKVKTVRQVWGELERLFPDIAERLKPFKKSFVVSDEVTYCDAVITEVRDLNRNHRKLWNPVGGRNPADPILIAVAKELNVVVVTDEKRSGKGYQKKIPFVCIQRNVGCTDRLDFLRKIGCDV